MEDFFNKHGMKLFWVYQIGSVATLIYLMFYDTDYNWWNWIILIPLNVFLAEIWPITWFWKFIFGL